MVMSERYFAHSTNEGHIYFTHEDGKETLHATAKPIAEDDSLAVVEEKVKAHLNRDPTDYIIIADSRNIVCRRFAGARVDEARRERERKFTFRASLRVLILYGIVILAVTGGSQYGMVLFGIFAGAYLLNLFSGQNVLESAGASTIILVLVAILIPLLEKARERERQRQQKQTHEAADR